MKDCILKIKEKDLVFIIGIVEINTKGNIQMTIDKVLVK